MPEENDKSKMTELDVIIRARIAVSAEFSQMNLENKLVVGLLLDAETGTVLNDDSKSTRFFVVEYQETTVREALDKIKYFLCVATDGNEIYGKPKVLTESELADEQRKASSATDDEWGIHVLKEIETVEF